MSSMTYFEGITLAASLFIDYSIPIIRRKPWFSCKTANDATFQQ